jgi:hypothetical protein
MTHIRWIRNKNDVLGTTQSIKRREEKGSKGEIYEEAT